MLDQIQKVFEYQGGQKIRTVIIDEEPWFVAKDVAEVLGFIWKGRRATLRYIDDEMIRVCNVQAPTRWEGKTSLQTGLVLNEPGLYKLAMRSEKPEALAFQNWIASEVLPSIRKHGLYMTPQVAKEAIDDTEAFLARALLIAKDKLDSLEAEAKELRPKAAHYDQYMDYTGSHSLSDVASLLNIKVQTLTNWMIYQEILKRNIKNELVPREAYRKSPYFRVKQTPHYIHTRVTPEGCQWLTSLYGSKKQGS